MKLNQIVKVKIPSVNMDGQAYVRVQNETLVLSGVYFNEEVQAKVVKRIKEGWVGEVEKVLKPSPFRIKSACSVKNCGGCSYLTLDYENQLKMKKQQIVELFAKNGMKQVKIHDVEGMEKPCAYRNKIIMSFSKDKQRKLHFGFYSENSHQIVDVDECLNHDDISNKILKTIKELVIKYKLEIYDEDRRTGFLRHVLIRRGFVTNQTLVCFVCASKPFPAAKKLIAELVEKHPSVKTVVQNINTRKTSIVLGDEEKVLFGKGSIEDELCGLRYNISSKSFYQINHDQTEKLYNKAIELMRLKGNEVVYDMYCGIGTIGMTAAKKAREVTGVEVNAQAIEDAKKNARLNKQQNIRFVCEDASSFMKKAAQERRKVDAVFIDPPRSGSDELFINSLVSMRPKQIVYISCNPQTQVRDLKVFAKAGYVTKDCYLYDLFPQTAHVESVCLLTRTK